MALSFGVNIPGTVLVASEMDDLIDKEKGEFDFSLLIAALER